MKIQSNYSRYDSAVSSNSDINKPKSTQAKSSIRRVLDAFYLEISPRARYSKEFNDPNIKYPIFNPDVLQYNSNLSLTYKS